MARKATRENVAAQAVEEARQRMTPEQRFEQHWAIIHPARAALEKAQSEVSTANGIYRGALKAYKKDGGDVDALLDALRFQKMEVEDANKRLAEINWHLRALGAPIGTQLGLFADGKTVAHHVDNDKIKANGNGHANGHAKPLSTKATIAAAKAQGKKAGSTGKSGVAPYEKGTPEELAFTAAWKTAQAEMVAKGLGRKKNGASKARLGA
jgi:hypothetical protein